MGKPNSIYSYNLGKSNGLGSSGNVFSFTNRQNGGLGASAYFSNLQNASITTITPSAEIIDQLIDFIGEYNGEYHVACLFTQEKYTNGIDDIIRLINEQFPNTKINFVKYVINVALTNVESSLLNFITSYPSSNKIIVSELTGILNRSVNFVKSKNLKILNISCSSSALTTQTLPNTITYAYYLSGSVTTSFYIIEDYNIQNIVILFDKYNPNVSYLISYRDTIYKQNNMLKKLNTIEYILNPSDKNTTPFYIPNNSIVYLLSDTTTITNKYVDRIVSSFNNNTSSFIFMSQFNYDMSDIFGNIPTLVSVNAPSIYTKTTDTVYKSFTNKNTFWYASYVFYDILYSINYCSENKIFITKDSYLNANPYKDTPPAWHTGYSIKSSYNGFTYCSFDILLTKDTIIDIDRPLYDIKNQNGTITRLPNSKSILKSVGVFPNTPTIISYLERNYIKIYEDDVLRYVKFDSNNTITDDGKFINTSETSDCKFIALFDRNTFFLTYIKKIFDNSKYIYPEVNLTMSKSIITRYIQSDNLLNNNKSFIEINEQLNRDNAQLIQANNNIATLEEKLAKLTQELNAELYAANAQKLEAMIAISKNEEKLALIQQS